MRAWHLVVREYGRPFCRLGYRSRLLGAWCILGVNHAAADLASHPTSLFRLLLFRRCASILLVFCPPAKGVRAPVPAGAKPRLVQGGFLRRVSVTMIVTMRRAFL